MDRLTLSIKRAEQALKSLQDILQIKNATDIERDAAIQRFEYTFETVWKAARHYLREEEGIDAASPKSVIRSCREKGYSRLRALKEEMAFVGLVCCYAHRSRLTKRSSKIQLIKMR